jgi:integrase
MAVFSRVRTHKDRTYKVWIAKWKDRGGRWRQKEFERKKDAEHHERAMIREVEQGIHVPDRLTKTFAEACAAWLDDCERRHRIGDRMSGYCLRTYRSCARLHVLPAIGGLKLTALTHAVLQEAIDKKFEQLLAKGSRRMKPGRVSRATPQQMIVVIRQVLSFSLRRGWLGAHPLAENPLRLADVEQERVTPPPLEDLQAILVALEHRPWRGRNSTLATRRLAVMLALYAGLRRGEICGLRWENVDFEEGIITVRHSMSSVDGLKRPKTRSSFRNVPMPPPLKEALLEHVATRRMEGYVLTGNDGKPLSPERISSDLWPRVLRLLGLLNPNGSPKYPFHSLRHAYVSMLLAAGYSLWHVSKLVGHGGGTRITEQVYGHLLPNDDTQRRAVASLAQMLEENRPQAPPPLPGKHSLQIRYERLRADARALVQQGVPQREVARRLGVARTSVKKWLDEVAPQPTALTQPATPPAHGRSPAGPKENRLLPPPVQPTLFD